YALLFTPLLNARYRLLKALNHIGMRHILTVPGEPQIPQPVHNDQTTCAGSPLTQYGYGSFSRLTCSFPTRYKIGGALCKQQAHKILAMPCTGYSCLLISIEATAHQR